MDHFKYIIFSLWAQYWYPVICTITTKQFLQNTSKAAVPQEIRDLPRWIGPSFYCCVPGKASKTWMGPLLSGLSSSWWEGLHPPRRAGSARMCRWWWWWWSQGLSSRWSWWSQGLSSLWWWSQWSQWPPGGQKNSIITCFRAVKVRYDKGFSLPWAGCAQVYRWCWWAWVVCADGLSYLSDHLEIKNIQEWLALEL